VKKQVAILGCGPSGLLAAHAAKRAGAQVAIFSHKTQSQIHGAQFLHEYIPGLKPSRANVKFIKVGTKEIYAEKVYGYGGAYCSWNNYRVGDQIAWSMEDAYQELWRKLEKDIVNIDITDDVLDQLENDGYNLLISTIPAKAMCERDYHYFSGQRMWVINTHRPLPGDNNVIIYSGRQTDPWYRFSRLFGHSYFEFGDKQIDHEQLTPMHRGVKPLRHNCNCRRKWMRMGRFGKWEKGVLVHQAFTETSRALFKL
jgi:hypothetical protein